ncbi:MAG: hypothetical protein IKH30_02130 [Clostridia bacterium]|nr:hypothetical protein [Clostridia bacterium]
MNSFANSLFSLLFGWARTIIQHVWNTSTSGHFSGFLSWLGAHWIWLVIVLVLCGTAADILVWLFRWKPYLVWRTKARRLMRWFKRAASPHRRFEKGYQGGVKLDVPQEEEPAEPAEPEWKAPEWAASPEGGFFTHSFTEALAREAVQSSAAQERQGRAKQENEYEPPPLVTESWLSGAYMKKEASAAPRRRRSEKYDKKKPAWTNKLMIPEVEEDSLLDGLPPAVDRQQAFHEPVYPLQSHTGADTGWQPSVSGQAPEGSYRR